MWKWIQKAFSWYFSHREEVKIAVDVAGDLLKKDKKDAGQTPTDSR